MSRWICCVNAATTTRLAIESIATMNVLLFQPPIPLPSPWQGATPPPLLAIEGQPLLLRHLDGLAEAGYRRVTVCVPGYTGEVEALLSRSTPKGMAVEVLDVADDASASDVVAAAAGQADGPVLTLRCDLWTDYDLSRLPRQLDGLACVVMVDNPAWHPHGDFVLDTGGRLRHGRSGRLTFSGIGVFDPAVLSASVGVSDAREMEHGNPLLAAFPGLVAALSAGQVCGEHHVGPWTPLLSPESLHDLDGVVDV
jgi:MurNAc alpha-1-phosphate uridylyltransferase